MIVSKDSPLRALPRGLSEKQIVAFDALRVSAEIAGQAYDELLSELRTLQAEPDPAQPKNLVVAVRHAWTFVDAVHRFRSVLEQARGIEHNHVYELFIRGTKSVKEMRNTAQHLNQHLGGIADRRQGAYGTLAWVVGAGETQVPKPMLLNVGTNYGIVRGPMMDFEERLPAGEIHRLQLELADRLLMLSDARDRLASIVRSLEGALAKIAEGKPRYESDQFFGFKLPELDEDQSAGEAATNPKTPPGGVRK